MICQSNLIFCQGDICIRIKKFLNSNMSNTQLIELIQQKDQMQKTIAQLTLKIQNIDKAKDFNKGLVDAQGFPRQDLDFGELCEYRNLKRKKAQLNNDHVSLMKQIQCLLFTYHSTLPKVEGEAQIMPSFQKKKQDRPAVIYQKQSPSSKSPLQKSVIDYLTPFGRVTLVQENSPAQSGGIRLNDLLSEFAQVNIYTPDSIKQIPSQVRENQEVRIVVMRPLTEQPRHNYQKLFMLKDNRQYAKVEIKIVPQRWAGRGLIGCKIDPI